MWIAHRGNIEGPDFSNENNPIYCTNALEQDYDVEIDIWNVSGEWYSGHDEPQYPVSEPWLLKTVGLWVHCKNLAALRRLLDEVNVNYFWHEEDQFTLTSNRYIWTYPGNEVTTRSIQVISGDGQPLLNAAGWCGDYVKKWSGR